MVLSLQLLKLVSTPSADTHLLYCHIIRKLLYLAIMYQPNIYYAMHYLSHFINRFSTKHYQVAKWVLHYLNGTVDLVICYNQHHFNV